MIINKFKAFESAYDDFQAGSLNEGVLSSITNYFSRMLGGSVAKLDKILDKYKDNEVEYWVDWAEARGKMAEVEVLANTTKSDPIDRTKYTEQRERVKKLQGQVEKKRDSVNDALTRQANAIIKNSARLKDYWEMKKAKVDEEAARESYSEVKKSTDNDTIHELFDNEIKRAAKKAKEKDAEFREKHGSISDAKFLDQAPSGDEDLSISGIKIKDLVSKPIIELQQKLKSISNEQLNVIQGYLEKQLKNIKDQRDEDIKLKGKLSDKTQASKEIDDISKKVKPVIDVLQSKIDYIDQLLLSSKDALKQEIITDPEVVTDNTVKELGQKGTNAAITDAIKDASEDSDKPTVKNVMSEIDDRVKKNFEESRGIIEEEVGEKIEDSEYAHLKNDLIALYGKLVFYYNKLDSNMESKTLQFGLIDFAANIYEYKKKNGLLKKDLSKAELDKQFEKYQK